METNMNLDQAQQTFITESRELLAEMEDALLNILESEDRCDAINAIFRAAHTIKGSAGLFGIDYIVAFTHVVESVLDRVREGAVAVDGDLVALMLSCKDCIGRLVDLAEAGAAGPDEQLQREAADLRLRLNAYLDAPLEADDGGQDAAPQERGGRNDHWHISLRFNEGVLRNGMDPLSFIRYLGKLGRVTGIACQPARLPSLAAMDPEACYLGFEIGLDSEADKAAIESAFEFVMDDCAIRILPPRSRLVEYIALIDQLGEESSRLGEMLVQCGTITQRELDRALELQRESATPELLGEILVQEQAVAQPVLASALAR